MPSRHISPQSFDDILSELGDDPAIPDPHGIRKPSSPPRSDPSSQAKLPKPPFLTKSLELKGLKFTPFVILGGILLLFVVGLFLYLEANKAGSELELNTPQNQILTLRKEFELSQVEWQSEREDIYDALDELEVSIHSKEVKATVAAPQNRPAATPHEAELRRWRYLGLTRMGAVEQAFFHTGKTTLMVSKAGLALGEWRLTQAEKEVAILTHPKGKSITLKSTKTE